MKFLLCLICLITVSCNAVIDPKSETIRSEDGYYIGTAHKFKFEDMIILVLLKVMV